MSIAEKHSQVTANNAAILENVQKVYDKGKAAGIAESDAAGAYETGKAEGIELGKKAEYDKFWDDLQENGTRTAYDGIFQGYWWTSRTLYPKYDIIPVGDATKMFYAWSSPHSNKVQFDLAARLEECGIILDTSNVTVATQMFGFGHAFTRLPAVDLRKTTNSTNVFTNGGAAVKTIDKIIVSESVKFSGWFSSCSGLTHITFEGTIGQSINFQWSPLSVVSMKSIITHLANYAGTDNDGVYSLTFSDTCWEALEADSTAPDGGTWKYYVASLGWVI